MSNFIRQNEVNIANQPLKVEQPLRQSSGKLMNYRVLPVPNIPQKPKLL